MKFNDPSVKITRSDRIESILSYGHVVGNQLRDRNGLCLMVLTAEELFNVPACKIRPKPTLSPL